MTVAGSMSIWMRAGFNLDTWKNLTLTYKHLEHLIDAFMPRTRRNNTTAKPSPVFPTRESNR